MTSNKYGAIKTTVDNIVFDSRRESEYYLELKMLLRSGVIRDLEMQVDFVVIVNGKKICTYYADFQYVLVSTNKTITVDVKGVKTPVYRMKKKLVEALYGVKIVEV